MVLAETLAKGDYVTIVAGRNLSEYYEPSHVIDLAEALGADIIAVGDSDEMLPDGNETSYYLGGLDDSLESIHTTDTYLIVGVDLSRVNEIPWAAFSGDGIVMTRHSMQLFRDTTERRDQSENTSYPIKSIPFSKWMQNATADTLEELTRDVIDLVATVDPSRIYSEQDEHSDPPIELRSSNELSWKVKQCEVCHTLTNHRINIGNSYPAASIKWQCPAVAHRNHDRLETLLKQRKGLTQREANYNETTEQGHRAINRLESQRAQLDAEIEKIRDWFDGRFDDIVSSDPELSDVPQFSPRDIHYK